MSSDNSPVMEVSPCPDCGRMIPPMNMMMHRAHACSGRARPVVSSSNAAVAVAVARNNSNHDNDDIIVMDENRPPSRKRSNANNNDTRPRGMPKRDTDEEDDDVEMVDLIEQLEREEEEEQQQQRRRRRRRRPPGTTISSPIDVDDSSGDEQDNDDEWACLRCTLLNSKHATVCDACSCPNPNAPLPFSVDHDGVRPPDAVRRERLIEDGPYTNGGGSPGAATMVGGGALLGGMLGAAGSYLRGRPMGSGALEGAISGAASGVFLNEVMRSPGGHPPSRRQRREQQLERNAHTLAEARSAGANGIPAYPVMSGTNAPRRTTQQPRPSIRVTRQQNTDGSITTAVISSSPEGGRTRLIRNSGTADRDPMLSFLLHSMMMEDSGVMGGRVGGARFAMPGAAGGNNIDRMSYEQLLSAFGDGTENLGANEETITSMPTATVETNPETGKAKLPEDARQCSICLEDFEQGQTRKTLPCLHGFHGDCVDKWLRSNAACPVCKFRLDGGGS